MIAALRSGEVDLVFIETKASVYGGQRALLTRARELDERGLPYRIIHPYHRSHFLDEATAAGLQGSLITPSHGRITRSAPARAAFVVGQLTRRGQGASTSRVIHVEAFDSLYLTAPLLSIGALRSSALVATVRSNRYEHFTAIDRWMLAKPHSLATNSEYSARRIADESAIPRANISVTYSPIGFADLDHMVRPESEEQGRVRVGFIGSLEPRKRPDLFLRCVQRARLAFPDREITAEIFGDRKPGTDHSIGIDGWRDAESEGWVRFHGHRALADIGQMIDIALCPFQGEPFGRVVAECAYLGIPTYVRRSGGLAEAGAGLATVLPDGTDEEFRDAVLARLATDLDRFAELRRSLLSGRSVLRDRYSVGAVLDREFGVYEHALDQVVRNRTRIPVARFRRSLRPW